MRHAMKWAKALTASLLGAVLLVGVAGGLGLPALAQNAVLNFFETPNSSGDNIFNLNGTWEVDDVSVTATGTELNLIDGVTATTAELNILDGVTATFTELNLIDGVTATTAELNDAADISAQAAIAANGDTLVATAVLHAGKVVDFGKTDGTEVTLPAATGTGHTYTFVMSVAATSSANLIQVANATDVMDGSFALQQDTDADGTVKMYRADVGDDSISFAGAATTGGIVGTRVTCTDYISGFWQCVVWSQSGGGGEVTPFLANVS